MTLLFRLLVLIAIPLTLCACRRADNGGDNGGRDGGHFFGGGGKDKKGRMPTFKYVKEQDGGCADVLLFTATADKREYLCVHADKKKFNLPEKGEKTIDIAEARADFGLTVQLWETAPKFTPYCNCVTDNNLPGSTWKAIRGKVTFTMLGPAIVPEGANPTYRVSARFENVVFRSESGQEATMKEATISDIACGWYAG